MLSLKKYKKPELITLLIDRTRNIAKMTNSGDEVRSVERALRKLNQMIYLHRAVIIEPSGVLEHKGGFFVDVTPYEIDEIVNLVYSPTPFLEASFLDMEFGLLPFISSSSTAYGTTSTILSYIDQISNLNAMVRKLHTAFDHYLWPITSDGHRFLQLRSKSPLVEVRFLPYIDPFKEEYNLFEDEFQFILELSYLYLLLENSIQMASGRSLGAFREMGIAPEYLEKKIKELLTDFRNGGYVGAPL